jgi:chromosome segregation ATPase
MQLSEATMRLKAEIKAKDEVKQQLAEVTTRLDNEHRKAKDDLKQQLTDMSILLDNEHKAKDDANQQLTGVSKLLDNERKAKDDLNQRLSDTTMKMDTANQQLTEMTTKYDDSIRREAELNGKLTESFHHPATAESICIEREEANTATNKRKSRDTEPEVASKKQKIQHAMIKSNKNSSLLKEKIDDFIETQLVFMEGNFISTKCIQEMISKIHHSDVIKVPEIIYQKILRDSVSSKFPDENKVFASRTRKENERTRGYVGLALFTAPDKVVGT